MAAKKAEVTKPAPGESAVAPAGEVNVVMGIQIAGTRDGQSWPAPGGLITLPGDEAEKLVRLGHATSN